MSLFLCLSNIASGQYCQKKCCQKLEAQKKDIKGRWSYKVGLSIEDGGVQYFCPSAHCELMYLRSYT